MLSVLLEATDDPVALSATLATLVPGAVDGLVREVIVIDRAGSDATRRVAEHAGCRFWTDEALGPIVAAARSDWLLLLEAGARPMPGWIEALSAHLAIVGDPRRGGSAAARLRAARLDRGSLIKRWLARPSALATGVVVARADALRLAEGSSGLKALAQAVKTRPIGAEIRLREPNGP